MINPEFWKNKKVFVTGHTGFKGSWLSLWLDHLGARVTGYALPPPTDPSLFKMAGIESLMHSVEGDVRDCKHLLKAMQKAQPDIVIHMAAQSLVRYSYANPLETFSTNVMGTANLLECVKQTQTPRAVVAVTSDKCYHNEEWVWGYNENSRLGGDDPYSASKGAAELVIHSFIKSYFSNNENHTAVASTRAGNVIGGGDWATDRLVPDIVRSLLNNEPTLIRNPQATRPWQHVLEPLHGYLILAEHLYEKGRDFSSAWNFGPPEDSEKTVGWIINLMYELWGASYEWTKDENIGPPECTFLKLDASKAKAYLGWQPKLDLETTLSWIIDWTKKYSSGSNMKDVSVDEIERFMAILP